MCAISDISAVPSSLAVDAFPTPLGWVAMCGAGELVAGLTMGHPSRQAALGALAVRCHVRPAPSSWHPLLRQRLSDYLSGDPVSFGDIEIDLQGATAFARRVVAACRRIPRGTTATYGELARDCHAPRAARAVGNVMARNRFPLIVPCHRVVPAQGGLGGFSAASGGRLKRQLLQLEGWSE